MNMREKNYQISGIIVGLITLLSAVQTAQAAFFQNTFGLSDPHSTITFDEHVFPSGSGLTTQYADLGVNFSPFAYYAPYGGPNVSNFMPNGFAYPFSMIF